jgi:hypothetical protein
MGSNKSKAAVNTISEAVTEAAISTVQNCEVSAQQTQNVNVVNTGFRLFGSYKIEQQSDISSQCFSDVNKQLELQNKVTNAIIQSSEATGTLGTFGNTKATAATNVTNMVRNVITMQNVQNSYTAIRQSQEVNFINSGVIGFEQGEITQGSKLFAAATLKELDKAGVFNAITNNVDQQATAESRGVFDSLAASLGTIGMAIMFMVIIIIVILIAGGVYILNRSSTNNSAKDEMV